MKWKSKIGLSVMMLAITGSFSSWILLAKQSPCPRNLQFGVIDEQITSCFTNVTSSIHHAYHAVDDRGNGLDCLDVIEHGTGQYFGVHHHYNGTDFEVHLVHSTDLMNWTFIAVLARHASMPDLFHDAASGLFFLAHEQWNGSNVGAPCTISVEVYPSIGSLVASEPSLTYRAPSTLSCLEGTPNVHAAGSNGTSIEMTMHYNDAETGLDRVALARLSGLNATPAWLATPWNEYNRNITCLGAGSHIGARYKGTITGHALILQEVQLVRDDWSTWQPWYYNETSAAFTPLVVTTHGGSTSFTNPHFTVVSMPGNPASQCLFVSHFLPVEGAAAGEAGQCIYFRPLP